MTAPRSEECDVQGVRLRLRSGASEVQEVRSARWVAVRRVLRLEHGGEGVGVRWVAGLVVEVRRAVEDARVQDELVDLVVGRVGSRRGAGLADVGDEGRPDGL